MATLRVDETQPAASGCMASAAAELPPQGLAVTYSFDAPESGEPYAVAIRFTGSRVGVDGKPGAGDRFDQVVRVDGLHPGTGRVTVTARPQGVTGGEWKVLAAPVVDAATPEAIKELPRRVIGTTTSYGHLSQGPGVRLSAWPILVSLGAVVAVALQAVLAARAGIAVGAVLVLSLLACLLGFVGGKVWYLVLHRRHPREFLRAGACIQGFLLVAFGVLAGGALVSGLPVGALLDATAPGAMLGMAVGRPGCFLTGCCTGRPTASRWGLWSSNRSVGVRRVPVQLIEAGVALVIGAVAFVIVLAVRLPVPGAVFVGVLAAYTFCRQLLFPLRVDSHTRTGRVAAMAICAAVLSASVGVSLLS
ncbi:prolipoprotein diacylglyceryl transferase family protein [Actinophytocola sp. NPDC049390]|uniref:prolipoprotein diacylglyceryl transferase family protein n=1 Tax=Actinophytocola sp. NPDC049390 TaxID=3363894 RepID=UPI0037BD4DAC